MASDDNARPAGHLTAITNVGRILDEDRAEGRKWRGQYRDYFDASDKMRAAVRKIFPTFKRGGRVKRTGLALVHKGEYVIPARKRRIWLAHGGRCEECKTPVPALGAGVTYDHRTQLAFDGEEADENVRPLCDECCPVKDAADATARGKVRRLQKKAVGAERKPSRLRSAGFRTDIRRRMDGTVERKG